LTTGILPDGLLGVELEVSLGRFFKIHPGLPSPNMSYDFVWDGFDSAGRFVGGIQRGKARVGYTYGGSYQGTSQFGYNGNGTVISGDLDRFTVTLWQEEDIQVGEPDADFAALGGWTLSEHHINDPRATTVFLGNGVSHDVQPGYQAVTVIAGTYENTGTHDGLATNAKLAVGNGQVAEGPDGAIYLVEQNGRKIVKISRDGMLTTIAGASTNYELRSFEPRLWSGRDTLLLIP
jgi:hypothetical protein